MAVESQATIEYNAENFHFISHRHIDASDGHRRKGQLGDLGLVGGADNQGF